MILMKKKRHAITAGLCLGLAMAFIPAPIAQPKAEAAIAVWDEKNIEQAIQTAIKTAAILDVQQKELLLQIINQRKIDINRLADIVQKYQQKEAQSQKILAGDANVIPGAILAPGQLSDVSMTEALIRARIGDLKDILNGRITVVDAAENERKRQETIDETYKAAALQELAAREKLKTIVGVGDKVADCVLLFAFHKTDAFPKDVWVKRIMAHFYPGGLPECTTGIEGIAQQYLFDYVRNCGGLDENTQMKG